MNKKITSIVLLAMLFTSFGNVRAEDVVSTEFVGVKNVKVVNSYSDAAIIEWETDVPDKMMLTFDVTGENVINSRVNGSVVVENLATTKHKVLISGGVGTWVTGSKLYYQIMDSSTKLSQVYEAVIGEGKLDISNPFNNYLVNNITDTGFTISWSSRILSTSNVVISDDGFGSSIEKKIEIPSLNHSVEFKNLKPGHVYEIAVHLNYKDNSFSSQDFLRISRQYSDSVTLLSILNDDKYPVITNLKVADLSIGPDKAIVSWNTDIDTDSLVFYVESGLTSYSWQGTDSLSKIHSVLLPSLKSFTTYKYYVNAKDANGNITKSEMKDFTTTIDDKTEDTPIACTMEYAPVCGEVSVQCVKTPCNPVRETFSNKCMMSAKKAKFLYSGECKVESVVVGEKPTTKIPQTSDFTNNANRLTNDKMSEILTEIKQLRDLVKEQNTKIKYLEKLTSKMQKLSDKMESALNNFITYGVDTNTQKLGEGERAAVISSYKSAFEKLPATEAELADAIKIASGRWPSATSAKAEKRAKAQFEKIYKRIADMNNANDNAAVTVMAYGLRQKAEARNMISEANGIKTFKTIYGKNPTTTDEWNAMQAITYSGASRGKDSDGDLLIDDREKVLGTNPNKKDTDGDGYLDGIEVANGFDPLKK